MERRLQAHGRADLLDAFDRAMELLEPKEEYCIDCNCVIHGEEKEEGRCSVCSDINAMDIYLTGKHPDDRG